MKKEKMEQVLDLLKEEKDGVSKMICSILLGFEEETIEGEEVRDEELLYSPESAVFLAEIWGMMGYKSFNDNLRKFVALWKWKKDMKEREVDMTPDDNKMTEEDTKQWM